MERIKAEITLQKQKSIALEMNKRRYKVTKINSIVNNS